MNNNNIMMIKIVTAVTKIFTFEKYNIMEVSTNPIILLKYTGILYYVSTNNYLKTLKL